MATEPVWTEHTYRIPASHPRGYRRGVRDPKTSRLQLSVKQYIPINRKQSVYAGAAAIEGKASSSSDAEAITLILHHGMPPAAFKESYEPFLTELLSLSEIPPIRAVWAYDDVAFGASYDLNKDSLGDTHHWHDSARDLLMLTNHFAAQMIPPVVGMGQSWGAVAIAMAAAWSPGLFAGVILSEPLLENAHQLAHDRRALGAKESDILASHGGRSMAMRRTRWPNMSAAQSSFARSRIFASYDPRVLSLIYKHEFRQHPDGSVELIPPNAQVVPYFMRAMPALTGHVPDHDAHEIHPEFLSLPGFGISQGESTAQGLGGISCQILVLWSTKSYISGPAYKTRILARLGTGAGGAGGKAKGQVDEASVVGGHSLPYFQPKGTADAVAAWLYNRFWPAWSRERDLVSKEPPIDAETLPDELLDRLRMASKL